MAHFDVAGIGAALLDFTVEVEDSFLEELGLRKGRMHLVEEEKSREILKRLEGRRIETTPGGSSANTIAGVAVLGGRSVFQGKVGRDGHGDVYIRESEKGGVTTRMGRHDGLTGHAITFITPDTERTFAVHLGASLHFRKEDLDPESILASRILHIEGYQIEVPGFRDAYIEAMEIAKKGGVRISIDLSDPSLIMRTHGEMKRIVKEYADIVFANEEEARAFTGEERERALDGIRSLCDIAVVKLGAEGSLIREGDEVHIIPAYKTNVINTNGAGDMFAAGVLYGIVKGFPIAKAGLIGSYAASLVVSQVGARLRDKIALDKVQMGI